MSVSESHKDHRIICFIMNMRGNFQRLVTGSWGLEIDVGGDMGVGCYESIFLFPARLTQSNTWVPRLEKCLLNYLEVESRRIKKGGRDLSRE